MVVHDTIHRLTDVLTSIQKRPSAQQQLTIRPVNSATMRFDEKIKKFELFECLFHTLIKMQPEISEHMKIDHFHAFLRKGASQTFRNINTANRQTQEDVLIVLGQKNVKPESQATAEHKWHRLVFDPSTTKLPDVLVELNQGAKNIWRPCSKHDRQSLLCKNTSKLKLSFNMTCLQNG